MCDKSRFHRYFIEMKKTYSIGVGIIVGGTLVLYLTYVYVNTPPSHFPINTRIEIPNGASESDVVRILKHEGIIRSSLLLRIQRMCIEHKTYIQAGVYSFSHALTSREVAHVLTQGMFIHDDMKLVLPEGFSVKDFEQYIPDTYTTYTPYDMSFLEGTLFPDTYYISNAMSMTEIIEMLSQTMRTKLASYHEEIMQSHFTENEVIVFASILEREAHDIDSMRHVSGILHNRLKLGMPLQVDATLNYILDKTSSELTMSDLSLESPFNTYIHTGLPPTPIANPGLQSIEAVLRPQETDDIYYLTDTDGVFHYAKTFEEHVRNKHTYLR
jgi:UPF0755 protein